jgi:hypothetical protein
VEQFIGKYSIILDIFGRYKGRLERGNEMMEKNFETVGQDFRDGLINDVTKGNWSKVVDSKRTQLFGNKSTKGVVLFLKKIIFHEEIPNILGHNQIVFW